MALQLGPLSVTRGDETIDRIALLLWGPSTAGKTTFAATAPGDKLWLSFGDNEHLSVVNRDDVLVSEPHTLSVDDLFKHAQSDNPFGLDQLLADNPNIGTVVCDSLTAIVFRALQKAVKEKVGAGRGFNPTMLAPGQSAYGGRNAIVLEVVTGLLRVTAKHNVHCIITAHEADPTTRTDERGNQVIEYISVQLGGQLVNNMTFRLSEIWYLSQETTGERARRLAIRATRLRRPMKTRMFTTRDVPEFELTYDAAKPDDAPGQMTIAKWHREWLEGGKKPLPIPTAGAEGAVHHAQAASSRPPLRPTPRRR